MGQFGLGELFKFLGGPGGAMNFGLQALGGLDQRRALNEANQANLDRYWEGKGKLERGPRTDRALLQRMRDQFMGGLGGQNQRTLGRFDKNTRDLMEFLTGNQRGMTSAFNRGAGELRGDFARMGAGITGGFQDRLQRGMANLAGAGEQEERDIRRDFGNLQSQQQQDLTSRGLTGTTALAGLGQGIQRQQGQALGRARERVRGQRLDLDARLSGDLLGAMQGQQAGTTGLGLGLFGQGMSLQERQNAERFGFQSGRRSGRLGMQDQFGRDFLNQGLGFDQQALGQRQGARADLLNWIQGRSDIGPDQGLAFQRSQGLGQGAGTRQASRMMPSGTTSFFRGFGGGLGGAAAQTAGQLPWWLAMG